MPPAQVQSDRPQVARMDARYTAAVVITEVIRNRKHLEISLARHLAAVTDTRDKALASEISYGVMRWYPRLVFIANILLKTPLKTRDTDILALIYCGLYQLIFLRIPDHAAISATVETARKLQKPWAGNLVNAVLRRYQRESSRLEHRVSDSEVAAWAHPEWLIAELRRQWPQHWQKILDANNQYPPLQLRLNLKRQNREQYLSDLQQAGIEAAPARIVDTGVTVCNPVNVEDIPGFKQGDVSVQDYGAQLAAPLLDAHTGQRVLDACAAPGGKTAHIHERTPDLEELVAVELDAHRVELLRNTIKRLGLRVNIIHADVCDTGSWWDGRQF
ncbi:MAG: transcription antitermination factor NusB, partial [Gammaproteobacteria bacterium]